MRVRVVGSPIFVDTFRQLGADPVNMNWGDATTAFQQGVVDGQENPVGVLLPVQIWQYHKYATFWNYLVDPLVVSTIYAATTTNWTACYRQDSASPCLPTRNQGVLRSEDGGATWEAFSEGLLQSSVLTLNLDPTNRTLYAGTWGGGVRSRSLAGEGQQSFTLYADPNPLRICDRKRTELFWIAPGVRATQIRVGSSEGRLFAAGGQEGSALTGEWVRKDVGFWLLNASDGSVLAKTMLRVTDSACDALVADPNPIRVCEGSVGSTTLSWFVAGVDAIELRVGSPTGKLMAVAAAAGSIETGNWVRDEMEIFLLDRSTGEVLGQVRLHHTRVGCSN